MRNDLSKVFYEHERANSKVKFNCKRHKFNAMSDEIAGQYSMSTPFLGDYYSRKNNILNFSMIKKLLEKHCGRKWDEVYSELCKTYDVRKYINFQLIKAIKESVISDTYIEDDELFIAQYNGHWSRVSNAHYVYFFVHPTTGILTKNPAISFKMRTRQQNKNDKVMQALNETYHKIDKDNELRQVNGIWYIYTWEDISPPSCRYFIPPCPNNCKMSDHKAWWNSLDSSERDFYKAFTPSNDPVDLFVNDYFKNCTKSPYSRTILAKINFPQPGRIRSKKQAASNKIIKQFKLNT